MKRNLILYILGIVFVAIGVLTVLFTVPAYATVLIRKNYSDLWTLVIAANGLVMSVVGIIFIGIGG